MDDSRVAADLHCNSAATTGDNGPSPPAVEAELAAITKAIFGVPGEFETIVDPEWPDMKLVGINLDVRADVAALDALEKEWHRRVIAELGMRAMGYALCVYRVTDDG
jgi:hypothetical protein